MGSIHIFVSVHNATRGKPYSLQMKKQLHMFFAVPIESSVDLWWICISLLQKDPVEILEKDI